MGRYPSLRWVVYIRWELKMLLNSNLICILKSWFPTPKALAGHTQSEASGSDPRCVADAINRVRQRSNDFFEFNLELLQTITIPRGQCCSCQYNADRGVQHWSNFSSKKYRFSKQNLSKYRWQNFPALNRWNRKGDSEYSRSESNEMVWACRMNGWVPYIWPEGCWWRK